MGPRFIAWQKRARHNPAGGEMLHRMLGVFQDGFLGSPSHTRHSGARPLRRAPSGAMASNPESRSNYYWIPGPTLRVTPMTDASAFLDSGFARAKGACAPE
jgi:hypothetical protein